MNALYTPPKPHEFYEQIKNVKPNQLPVRVQTFWADQLEKICAALPPGIKNLSDKNGMNFSAADRNPWIKRTSTFVLGAVGYYGYESSPTVMTERAYDIKIFYAGCYGDAHLVGASLLMGIEEITLRPAVSAAGFEDGVFKQQLGVCPQHQVRMCHKCQSSFDLLEMPEKYLNGEASFKHCVGCMQQLLMYAEPTVKARSLRHKYKPHKVAPIELRMPAAPPQEAQEYNVLRDADIFGPEYLQRHPYR